MNRSLIFVFAALLSASPAARGRRSRSTPAKLRLASANVVVLDAAAAALRLRKGGGRSDAHRVADQAHDRDGRARRQAAARTSCSTIDMDDFDLPQGQPARACAWASTLSRARDAAAGADGVGESRGVGARAALSGRHAGVRRGDERQGARARHDAARTTRTRPACRRSNVSTANDLAKLVRGRGRVSADPRILDHARALRRSAADRPDARLQQLQRAGEERPRGTSSCRRPATSAKPAGAW